MGEAKTTTKWGIAWVALVLALALHVIDEAANDFLGFYNPMILALRESYAWIPLPTFTFPVWIIGLAVGVSILLALSPLVFAGKRYLRPLAYFLGILMTANGLGHIGASVCLDKLVPGVYSSPVLLVASAALLITTYGCRPGNQAASKGA